MKKNKLKNGFTLVELLAVIVILGILILIAAPSIVNQLKKASGNISEITKELIFNATKFYMEKNSNDYPIHEDNVYCISLNTLVEAKELEQNLIDIKTGKEIDLNKIVKVEIENRANIDYDIVNDNQCEEVIYSKYVDKSGANRPELSEGMIPIRHDGSKWLKSSVYENWYDYNKKEWANVVLINEGVRTNYKNAEVGTEIKEEDVMAYLVWIPRYAYKITSCYHMDSTQCEELTGKKAGEIDVKFIKDKTNKAVDGTKIEISGYEAGIKDTSMHYFLHPAFTFGNEEIKGFWVAKFQPTAAEGVDSSVSVCNPTDNVDNKTVKIIPNVRTWGCINIKNAFNVSLNMKNKTTIYGWNTNEVDTHMMKNREWGAVAYLSKSKYGVHTEEVWNNSYNQYQTGCSGSGVDARNEGTCVAYNTENGVKASTTHNIYGIYDMSGGTYDYIMGNYNNLGGIINSGFNNEEVAAIDEKYIDRYYTPTEDMLNGVGMNYDKNIYGDAMYETSYNAGRNSGTTYEGNAVGSWYNDHSNIPNIPAPWFGYGGYYTYGLNGGMFNFNETGGGIIHYITFRPVVLVK